MRQQQPAGDLIELEGCIWYVVKGKNKTGIIVLHDYWGIHSQIPDSLDGLGLGANTIMIPDLFSFEEESIVSDVKTAIQSMKQLNLVSARKVVEDGIKYMKKNLKIEVIVLLGYSMGAALCWKFLQTLEVHGAVIFYGVPNMVKLRLDKIKMPVLACFGKQDKIKGFSDPETVSKLKDLIKKKDMGDIEVVELELAGHGFAATNTTYYSQKAMEEVSQRIKPFMKKVQKNADSCSVF